MTARAFPWAALPRVTRKAAADRVALRGAVGARSVPKRAIAALAELAGVPIDADLVRAGRASELTLASQVVSLRLSSTAPTAGQPPWWVVLELDPALVHAIVARVTRRPPLRAPLSIDPSPAVSGAFAATVAAAMRRAGVPVAVTDVGSTSTDNPAAQHSSAATFTVVAASDATSLRAVFPESLLERAVPSFGRRELADLGALPLDLPVVACRVVATAAEIASLGVGDAWMLGDAWRLGPRSAKPRGGVALCDPSSERGLAAVLEADGRIVLGDGVEELGWSIMDGETPENAALVEAVGEVPVVVRVEIGVARMKAKEWSALGVGDVVALGSKVGGPVVLRVSGTAVAEGELVDLEGEIGVRIRRRLTGGSK